MNNVRFSFTRVSGNSKTGPIPVSMTSRSSCPDACALKGNGCYAETGIVRMHWQRLDQEGAGYNLEQLAGLIRSIPKGQLWRHNVAGDIPSDGKGYIDAVAIEALTQANKGRNGFTYTHNVVQGNTGPARANRALIKWANDNGFTINLSANNPAEADQLAALNAGPVVSMLDEWQPGQPKTMSTPQGRPIVVCPAVSIENMSCAQCKLCANPDRASIVGFPIHGNGKRKARTILLKTV